MRRNKGDCLRRCVARILGRPNHRVPDFVGLHKGRWLWHLGEWCRRTGHAMVYAHSTPAKPAVLGSVPRYIAIGPSVYGAWHAVVYNVEGTRPGVEYDGGNPLRYIRSVIVIWPRTPSAGRQKPCSTSTRSSSAPRSRRRSSSAARRRGKAAR